MPIDFIGKRDYYTKAYINKANAQLSRKLASEKGQGDEASGLAEWEFTYALGHGETLPGCRARLASEYDDHLNGIDIFCKLEDEDGGRPHVFGVDISTATSPKAVIDKISRGDEPKGGVPIGCSFIKFYEDDGFYACLKGVPRFVVGASPLFVGHQKYLDKFHLEEDGSVSHTPDPDLQFNILSSLYLQSKTLELRLMKEGSRKDPFCKRAIETCDAVRVKSRSALRNLMGLKQGEKFSGRFYEEIENATNLRVNNYTDACYRNIMNESLRRHDQIIRSVRKK